MGKILQQFRVSMPGNIVSQKCQAAVWEAVSGRKVASVGLENDAVF